jgi:hypothetical protein
MENEKGAIANYEITTTQGITLTIKEPPLKRLKCQLENMAAFKDFKGAVQPSKLSPSTLKKLLQEEEVALLEATNENGNYPIHVQTHFRVCP